MQKPDNSKFFILPCTGVTENGKFFYFHRQDVIKKVIQHRTDNVSSFLSNRL
ncbi:unnamed protein product [Acanthoscelides obtectus]|uniref:Uncharacterized protein n=1 Tax=Acanthoscelides obtectus TaxID=200917 RepID=A0A9P0KMW1_ACAOB|nr:unnamed protein product [Acanthoscelides obtectus]CAK1631836.1 hypothetical protein AOBTE_LOCUS7189 [Acanthoscelides obtectus]